MFDVLLTVHLSIFILVINQLDEQNLFYNEFIKNPHHAFLRRGSKAVGCGM